MESTLEGPATLEDLMVEYDSPPQRRKKVKSKPQEEQKHPRHPVVSTNIPMENEKDPNGTLEEDGPHVLEEETITSTMTRPTSAISCSEAEGGGLDLEVIRLPPGDEAGSGGVAGGAVSMATGEEPLSPAASSLPGRQTEDGEEEGTDTGDTMSTSEILKDGAHSNCDGSSTGQQEEEEEEPEMTKEEKKTMYDAVCDGNIDLLDDLLDLPGADINMEWFGENLLMAAIRSDEPEMAAFLMDNGINRNFEAARLHLKNPSSGELEWYTVSCRQMAYERDMTDVVDVIDELNNNVWPFLQRPPRDTRIKRPLEDKLREKEEAAEAERERRRQMEQLYRRRRSSDLPEVTSEDTSSRDNVSVASRTSYGSSFAFSDATSVRGDRKRKQSKAAPYDDTDCPLLTEEGIKDGTSAMAEGEDGEGEEEEEEEEMGPFFVPLGPTHMFPYPAEDEPPTENPHRYRSNRTALSRRDANQRKIRSSFPADTSVRAESTAERAPSVGSYRSESRLWTPQLTSTSSRTLTTTSTVAPVGAGRHNGRHTTSLPTRLMSPWKDDDPSVVAAFQKRSKSASSAAGKGRIVGLTRGGLNLNPALPGSNLWKMNRSQRPLFPLLSHSPQPQLTGLPYRDNFISPLRSAMTESLVGLGSRAPRQVTSRTQERGWHVRDDVTLAEDTGGEQEAGREPSTPLVTLPRDANGGTAPPEGGDHSRATSGRSRAPRSHSPAGYLRAFNTAARRQAAPSIHVVPPT